MTKYIGTTNYEELWRKLRNDNNPLADTVGELLEGNDEDIAQAQLVTGDLARELRDALDEAEELREQVETCEAVIEDKLVEIDALKASLALSNRLGQALTNRRSISR